MARRMAVSGLRQNNERAVLTVVASVPGSSAAQIARATGLGPQSVSRILGELENAGLIRRGEARKGQRGQPAVPIYMSPDGAYCVGCEVGWRHMHILIRNLGGEILGEHKRYYAYPDAEEILAEVVSLTKLLLGLVPQEHLGRVVGIGLAMPSGIARNANLVGAPEHVVSAWTNFDLAAELGTAIGQPLFVFNDGNAGCWAELAAWPAPRPANLAYLQVGTFLGAGLIADGRLWEGPTGNSANLGSMVVCDSAGNQQFAHLTASIMALEKRMAAAGQTLPTGRPASWDWDAMEPIVSDWLDEASVALAHVIINTSAVMEFGTAIVDGVMPRHIVERLVEKVRERIAVFPVLTSDKPTVVIGRLGADAPARGAALKPMFRRLFSRDSADLAD
ncbi:ROK family transcriptional regulator [Devosia sp. XJ19-1]|uniref:ROK family transcriptional regulator n=1 Tax=Devosia ureilytica TaxID=2952754 RepID=A0A9Q4APH5_9HYPH|nr:ROK family transcriptional regulator [Devosia ureilytica]MCP8883733.1 ROK family transcriptional regulator [Devosia ureilytica]MCP8887341.1 ROK family transcriptional regulator [Devosia ureilytica]